MLSSLTALLLTALLHSTLLGLAALVVARRTESPTRRTWILRAALIAPLVTAALQVGAGGGLGWNGWSVRGAGENTALAQGSPSTLLDRASRTAALNAAPGAAVMPLSAQATGARSGTSWRNWLLAVWGAGALGGCLLLVHQRRRFLRSLRRSSFDDVDAQERLTALTSRSGIELSASDALNIPLAVSSSEICLPRAHWGDLPGGQKNALLAHELAHVERRDPFWFLVENIVERALFLQPLMRILRRDSRRAAELACDEHAARVTARPLELARCLATVAGWTRTGTTPASMASMAHGDAPVVDRVERLLALDGECPPEGSQRAFTIGLSAALLAFACVAPGVTTGDPDLDLEFASSVPLSSNALMVAIETDGSATLSTNAGESVLGTFDLDSDMKAFGTALASAAGRFPRGGPGPFGDTLADGVLRIRTTADTPFFYAQLVMQACGGVDVQLWNLELETTGTRDVVFPYQLPVDVDATAVRPGRVDLALRVGSSGDAERSLEFRVLYGGGPPTEEIEEEPEESIEEIEEELIEEVADGGGESAEMVEEVATAISAIEEVFRAAEDLTYRLRGEQRSLERRIDGYLDDQWVAGRAVAIDRVGFILATTQAETVLLDVRRGITGREIAALIDDVIGAGATHLVFRGVFAR